MNKKAVASKGKIFVISGPSGSGKTTLRDRLLKDKALKRKLAKSVSLTTRPKRSKEKEARDYFFVKESEFKRRLDAKKILEWTKYLGYYYGTPKGFVDRKLKAGRVIVLCLDLKGAKRIGRLYPGNSVTIFINPPSVATLEQRIKGRCTKTAKEEIMRRIRLAKAEMNKACHYDYCLVNENLDRAAREFKKIILKESAV